MSNLKKVYHLRILVRDDYFRSHDTLVCEILNIDLTDTRTIENTTKINGKVTKSHVFKEQMVNGKYRRLDQSEEYFETLERLKEYIQQEYTLVHSTDSDFLLLVNDDSMNSVVAITNFKASGMSCSNTHVDLQKLLGLKHNTNVDELSVDQKKTK